MTEKEFLSAIEKGLRDISAEEREKTLEYYKEMIEDRMESGQTEEEAVADIGNADDIVAQILAESPPAAQTENKKPGFSPLVIVLLVLGAPIWASLALSAVIVVFAVYIVIWSLIISLYAVAVSFGGAALGCILSAAASAFAGEFTTMLFYIGAVLFFAGAAVLLFIAAHKAAGLAVKLSVFIAKSIIGIFKRKAVAK